MDTAKIEFELMPKALRVGVDLVGVVNTLSKSNYSELDVSTDIAIHKYLLNFDYGLLKKQRSSDLIQYKVNGSYFRAGIDFNILNKDPDGNAFFVGLKYARGKSNHALDYSYTDPIFGETIGQASVDNVKARWFELNSGVKVKIFWEIWLGFTGRLKFASKYEGIQNMEPYEIPGYGLADRTFNWGFDYYLFYRIPFTKKEN